MPGGYKLKGRERSPKIQRRKSPGGIRMVSRLQSVKVRVLGPTIEGVLSLFQDNRDVE